MKRGARKGAGGVAVWVGAGVVDDGPGGPVKVGFAEPGLFGDECGEGGRGLVEGVGVGGGVDDFAVGVDGGELPGHGGFGDGVPAEGVDGVGAGGDAKDLGLVVVGCLGELKGFFVLGVAV